MNKQEIKDIKKHGYNPDNILEPNEQVLDGLIIMSNGSKELHDSGFPFIKIYGIVKNGLVDLGWHDHYLINFPVNIDSLGKNIFHLMLWCNKNKQLKVQKGFYSVSTFQVGDMFSQNEDFVFVS